MIPTFPSFGTLGGDSGGISPGVWSSGCGECCGDLGTGSCRLNVTLFRLLRRYIQMKYATILKCLAGQQQWVAGAT
eukprot:gene8940-biopygen14918